MTERRDPRTMTGLEVMQAMLDGNGPRPAMGKHMNMTAGACSLGQFTFEAIPDATHLNPMGTVHGGFAATVLDSAMACAVHTTMPIGYGSTTLDINITYVKAITPAVGKLFARGEVITTGKRIATAQGRLTDADGTLYAMGTTTCMAFPMPAAKEQ